MQKKFESERQADEKLKALIYKKSNKKIQLKKNDDVGKILNEIQL